MKKRIFSIEELPAVEIVAELGDEIVDTDMRTDDATHTDQVEQTALEKVGEEAHTLAHGAASSPAKATAAKSLISKCTSKTSKNTAGKLQISGMTQTTTKVTTAAITYTLQCYTSKQWKSVFTTKKYERHNSSSVSKTVILNAKKKRKYRTKATHYVNQKGQSETRTTYSNTIYYS
ncbi:hypothetical protein [Numidum massiliense]|uniref:hypothetical protein n=1 Tax=Numidum massiliense TaxID=1522315 RepID=UPI0006D5B19C|nr:hypothetical protein [Numidum massiliense]